jgi:hypothetical protein
MGLLREKKTLEALNSGENGLLGLAIVLFEGSKGAGHVQNRFSSGAKYWIACL